MAGNRALASKRVRGPSAQRLLLQHIALEHCYVAGCTEPVFVTKNETALDKRRYCASHLTGNVKSAGKGGSRVASLLKFTWED